MQMGGVEMLPSPTCLLGSCCQWSPELVSVTRPPTEAEVELHRPGLGVGQEVHFPAPGHSLYCL